MEDKDNHIGPFLKLVSKNQSKKINACDYYNAGLFNLDRYNLNQALRDFSTAIFFDNGNYTFYLMRGIVYLEKECFCEALSDLSKAIKMNSLCWDAYRNRGYAYFRLQKFIQALKDWEYAVSLNPEDEFSIVMQKTVSRKIKLLEQNKNAKAWVQRI